MDPFFEENGYKIVRSAYRVDDHRPGLPDLFGYCKLLTESGDDKGSPGSPAFSNEVEMCKLMMRLMPRVSAETGLSLYPTYAYMRRYGSKSVLPRHKDRAACEISCTICIGYDGDYSWPFRFSGRDGREHEVIQDPGDLLIYRGIDLEHWREPADERVICHAQAFVHYVDQDGPHQNEVLDLDAGRKGISALTASMLQQSNLR